MAAVSPAGPEPTIRSFVSVRPGPPLAVEGPPAAGTGNSSPNSIVSGKMGAGAYGAATEVSPEKSMVRPPKGLVSLPSLEEASSLVVADGLPPFLDAVTSTGRVCLLIDASIARGIYPRGVYAGRAPRVSQRVQLRQDLAADQLELLGLEEIADAEQDVLGSGIAQLAEALDDLVRRLRPITAVGADPE